MRIIGIDPGVETGFAEYDTDTRQLREVIGTSIYDAQDRLRALATLHCYDGAVCGLLVIFEDARNHRVRFGRNARKGRAVLQGVGSVKRDCGMWQEFLDRELIPYATVKPRRRATKKGEGAAALFQQITGWKGRTNEHGRDAAMFIYGLNASMAEAMVREWEQKRRAA